MNITIYRHNKGTLNREHLESMRMPMPPMAGRSAQRGMGTRAVYKSGDACVADSPYGVVVGFVERTVNVPKSLVKAHVDDMIQKHRENTGLILYGDELARVRREITEALTQTQMPTDTDLYVYFYGDYCAINTTSARKLATAAYYLQQAGIELVERVTFDNDRVHEIGMAGEVGTSKVVAPICLMSDSGKGVALSNVDADSQEVSDYLNNFYVYHQLTLSNMLATYTLKAGSICSASMSKPAKREVDIEHREAPELGSVLDFCALVAMILPDYLEVCSR